MLELVKYIAQALVDEPDEVKVKQTEGEKSIVIELSVAPSDMGKGDRQAGAYCQGHPRRCQSVIDACEEEICCRNCRTKLRLQSF